MARSGPVAGFGNDISGSVKGGEFLDYLRDHQFLLLLRQICRVFISLQVFLKFLSYYGNIDILCIFRRNLLMKYVVSTKGSLNMYVRHTSICDS
jgi:hypothetical protein